ncbi:Adenylosuccinate lyase [Candidatus Sulfotelmatomonas gaucii]|uniref:Adenylosuccinate lyase n=1 Tax=Candidatus Sulfuritelmatomonas gaucii TaxID=2043161 RepID=A0A2N9LA24_9BACT|nr:Adenylosuccinate lyase [Candidatus Sulfotelmatomonas gaucii]
MQLLLFSAPIRWLLRATSYRLQADSRRILLIERYTRRAMGAIWTDENKYRYWLRVEAAASAVLAEDDVIPAEAAEAIAKKATVSATRVQEIEAEVKHDVIAFTTAVADSLKAQGLDAESRWLHYGLTSNDIVDTAQALQIKEASALIREGITALLAVLKRRALEFKHTPTIGRTHGIHAEPTTFGLKLLNWYAEMERNLKRFDAAAEDMRVGKLSGAVGTFGHLSPKQEEKVCERLRLKPALVATQVIQRDRHAAYIATLAIIGSTLDKIAVEVRHLQRTEVREAQEYFSEKQKGSSAMPHKKNPITSEQISGLARVLRGNAQAALENVPLWHERDISHSSVERIIFPDSTILVDYLLAKTTDLIDRLLVYPERMKKNLESTGGLIFSGQLLLDLAEAGMLREDAYRLVQGHAMRAWKEDLNFREEVARDAAIAKLLSAERLAAAFDYTRQLGNVDAIFKRVLGS